MTHASQGVDVVASVLPGVQEATSGLAADPPGRDDVTRAPRAFLGRCRSRSTWEGRWMNRRDFVGAVAVLAGLRSAPQASGDSEVLLRVMTVCGPISPEQTGLTLPHEHVLVDFIGADRVARDRYDADEVVRLALP